MIAISIFQSHALENDWVLFIHQKDLTNAILSFTIVTNDRPMRMVVVSAFCPSIDKPDNTPLVYLLLHLHEHWASFCDFVGVNMSKASWRITVRQLESLIRLSEAMAKMVCEDEVRYFKKFLSCFIVGNRSPPSVVV